MSFAYQMLSRALHDIEANIARALPGGHADGLAAGAAIVRAHMAGLPRSSGSDPGWHGGGDDPKPEPPAPPSPSPQGRVIDAEYTISDEKELSMLRQDRHALSNRE